MDSAMLVAYGPDGHPLVAEDSSLEQLQKWSREQVLHCPNCRGIVHVRGGPDKRTQIHFAHQKGECAWSTESESVRHVRGKWVISQWLRQQNPQGVVTLEERLPEPNRIADIYIVHNNSQRWAVEFQCAPLDIEEWKMRHEAYRKAGIIDIWIIGNNRREKQEAFIEGILATAHEIMFLDPLVTPPRVWLRWPITRHQALEWQNRSVQTPQGLLVPELDGWVGRTGYGMTLIGSLHEVYLDEQARLIHPTRRALEIRARLLQEMSEASIPNEAMLCAYLRHSVDEEALHIVLIPLMKAYLQDPALFRRYNYGRGLENYPPDESDRLRILKAQAWLDTIRQRGFTLPHLQALMKELPFVGPYASFAGYMEMLLTLASRAR